MEEKKETNILKDAAKAFVKGVTFGSVFDPNMREKNQIKQKNLLIKKSLIIYL